MTRSKAWLVALVLLVGCAVASAQEGQAGAGKLEVGGWPGGALYLVSGDDNTEVNFNNWVYGGGVSWYVNPRAAIEVEAAYGLGMMQGINWRKKDVPHVQVPNTLMTSGNIVILPGGTGKQVAAGYVVAPYVTGGAGMMMLPTRHATRRFGYTEAVSFVATNVGGGMKIFRSGDGQNWGYRIDYRLVMVNSKSDALGFFAVSKRRMGHRFYIGMLYTMKR